MQLQWARGSILIGVPMLASNNAVWRSFPITIEVYDAPAAVSATTYQFQGSTSTSTLSYPVGSTGGATIKLEEIMGALTPANDNASLRMVG